MSDKKQKYDMNSPEARALIDEIVHGTFMKEGTMVAFPTCFPGASVPIPADESHITALDTDHFGLVYGGTSGRLVHLFVASLRAGTGVVFDLGTVEGADHCAAVCCGHAESKRCVACVNGPGGGRIVTFQYHRLFFDMIQEWGFRREPFDDRGEAVAGERIVHAVTGEIIRCLTLDPEHQYQPTGNKRGGPSRPYGPYGPRKTKRPEP